MRRLDAAVALAIAFLLNFHTGLRAEETRTVTLGLSAWLTQPIVQSAWHGAELAVEDANARWPTTSATRPSATPDRTSSTTA